MRRKKPQVDLLQRQRRLGLSAARQQRKRFLQQLQDQRDERGAK